MKPRGYLARKGDLTVERGVVEIESEDDGREHAMRLGAWLSDQRTAVQR
ncbi:hypothetical protein [Streptomyces sp. NBC_01497]|nr:hypothetical protein [Streptomyces sp. NBC_01497]